MTFSNLWLSGIALMLDGILLWVYVHARNNRLYQTQRFGILLVNLTLINFMTFLYSLELMHYGHNVISDTFFSWVISMFIVFVPRSFLSYLVSVFYYDADQERMSRTIDLTLLANLAAVLLLGPLAVCENHSIHLNPNHGVLLFSVPAVIFLAEALYQGLRLKNTIPRRMTRALAVMFALCTLSVIVFIVFRTVPEYSFIMTLCPLLCEFTLEGRGMLTDTKTGLRSSNAFRISVNTRLESKDSFTLILIHSPNLSFVVTQLEEDTGTRIMTKLADTLTSASDYPVFRIDEDTFAILQDEPAETKTREIVNQLLSSLNLPFSSGSHSGHLHAILCVLNIPIDAGSYEDILMKIELLQQPMDYAGISELTADSLDIEAEKKLRQETTALREALDEHRMEVWYQPIYSTISRQFESAEALVRMRAKDGSLVPPYRFIPASEKSGLIFEVGNFVFNETAAFMASGEPAKLGVHYIEVNLSVEEAIQEWLPERLNELLSKHHADPGTLNIEITETASDTVNDLMMYNMKIVREEYRVPLSLDDFGTGYSNLSRLLTMPIDLIKFDRTMLLKAFESEQGKLVFEEAANMIHDIGLRIVSEGVETKEQADFVTSLGIEYIQGFYYAKPMPRETYLSFLKEHMHT